MKIKNCIFLLCALFIILISCSDEKNNDAIKILFLHHSTGWVIWEGDLTQIDPVAVKEYPHLKAQIPLLCAHYNHTNSTKYVISEIAFPKASPYGWNNYPFDYYNIWVKNAGDKAFMKEPTLEILSQEYDVIIFKHCFPVSNIQSDIGSPDIDSDKKTLGNYKLQYLALRDKLYGFSNTKFILFTGAMQARGDVSEEEAIRTREFFEWVIEEWDQPDDNIYLWDLYQLQTEGGLYFKDEYAVSINDSHPNKEFAGRVANLLFERIIDIIENNGKKTNLIGERL